MNSPSPLAELIQPVFFPSQRGVVGLVDDLLTISVDRGLQLDWRGGECRVRSIGGAPEEAIDVPLPKSVFRAVLARLAALCNERSPGSVSPYGGKGELAVGADPALVLSVAFTNTPDEQNVRISRIAEEQDQGPPQRPAAERWGDGLGETIIEQRLPSV